MAHETSPPWDALPHDPQRFFALPEGYDRRDLKRGYNRLIRQFKPDRHPAEFQQIRSAYEQLENYLRYRIDASGPTGVEVSPVREPVDANVPAVPTGESPGPAERSVPQPLGPDFFERVLAEPLEQLHEELHGSQHKTAFDYYALALLEDSQAEPSTLGLLRRLLRGLRKLPHDPGLTALVVQLLRDESLPAEQIPATLRAVARAMPSDRFYYLTEPMWDRALRGRPFAEFAQLLSECEAELHDHEVSGRVIFYLHLLRPAMWTASPQWLAEKFAFLENHYTQLPPFLEGDLECLAKLRSYVEQRSSFLNGDPARAALDNVLRAYGQQPDFEAERVFVDCQVRIASGELNLLQALPMPFDRACRALIGAWVWVDEDLMNRLADQASLPEQTDLVVDRSVRAFLDIQQFHTSCYFMYWRLHTLEARYVWVILATPILICFFTYAISMSMIESAFAPSTARNVSGRLLLGAMLIGGVMGVRVTTPRLLQQRDRQHAKMLLQLYETLWRPALSAFIRGRHLPYERLRGAIVGLTDLVGPCAVYIPHMMDQDTTMRFIASSVRCLA